MALPTIDYDDLMREWARRSLVGYGAWMMPGYIEADHVVRHMAPALEAVERGEIRRLIVTMPPRHSKSYHVSEAFPQWYLGRHPDRRVIAASHSAHLAYTFSRRNRNNIADPRFPFDVRVAEDKGAVQAWDTTAGGGYLAVGVGGSPTGHGANLIIIDDPIRGAADADSVTVREALWEWYQGTLRTRLEPGGAIVVTATRWHESDLTGRLLAEMERGGEQWHHVHLPAINDRGEPLWPERWPLEELNKIRVAVGSRQWAAQYQGRPMPDEGGMFKRYWWREYDQLPPLERAELYLDSAFKTGVANDYSALALWGVTDAGDLYLVKAWRDRVEFPDLLKLIERCHTEARSLLSGYVIPVVIEDKASGQSAIQTLKRAPYRLPVIAHTTGAQSKIARAEGASAMAEAGRMFIPRGADWLAAWLDEHELFPTGAHDDYVDTTSMAGARLGYQTSQVQTIGLF